MTACIRYVKKSNAVFHFKAEGRHDTTINLKFYVEEHMGLPLTHWQAILILVNEMKFRYFLNFVFQLHLASFFCRQSDNRWTSGFGYSEKFNRPRNASLHPTQTPPQVRGESPNPHGARTSSLRRSPPPFHKILNTPLCVGQTSEPCKNGSTIERPKEPCIRRLRAPPGEYD